MYQLQRISWWKTKRLRWFSYFTSTNSKWLTVWQIQKKYLFFYSTRKTTNLVFGFIEIKIFVDILFMNEFMSAATRNISNLLRRICVTFSCFSFFAVHTPIWTWFVLQTSSILVVQFFILSNPWWSMCDQTNKTLFKNIIIAGARPTYFQKSYFGKNPYLESK